MTFNYNKPDMNIDATSIIIVVIAFSFFAIPIGYDQWKQRTKPQNEKKDEEL
jgi:hypothetical protein